MTNIHKLTEFSEQVERYADHMDDPDDWLVFLGDFHEDYNITAPEAKGNDPEGGDGIFTIGDSGFAGDAFAEDCDPVFEAGSGDGILVGLKHIILVHRDQVSDEVIEGVYGEMDEPEAPADD